MKHPSLGQYGFLELGFSYAVLMPSTFEIFKAFVLVGASAFGGGGSAHIHHHIVSSRGWLSESEFLEGLSLSQLLPGPIFSNFAAHIGMHLRGTPGAIAAFVGVCLPGMLAILALSAAYFAVREFSSPVVTGALTGVAAGAVGISLATLARVAPPGLKSIGAPLIALAAFVANGVLHLPILWVLLVLLPLGIALNWNGLPDA